MLKFLIFLVLLLCSTSGFGNIIDLHQDDENSFLQEEVLYFTSRVQFNNSEKVELNIRELGTREPSIRELSTREQSLHSDQPPNNPFKTPPSFLEILLGSTGQTTDSDVAPTFQVKKDEAAERVPNSFFDIEFGQATIKKNIRQQTENKSGPAQINFGIRKTLENELKQDAAALKIALDVRSFYREHDFTSFKIKVGNHQSSFSLTQKNQFYEHNIQPQNRKKRTTNGSESIRSSNLFSSIPAFLFSGSFWIGIYILLCIFVLFRSLARKRGL